MRKLLLIISLISLIVLTSCHTAKQAKKAISKVMKYHPEVVANVCIDSFPCVTSKIDTTKNIEYEFIEVQCPGYDYDNAYIDTVWLRHSKTQLIEGPTVIATEHTTNTITKSIYDSAQIRICELELITVNAKCNDLLANNNKLQNKITAKNKWLMWLIIALLCSIIINLLLIKK